VTRSDQCAMCAHYEGLMACAAFPDRIPQEILTGEHDHREPYDGDQGIRWKPAARGVTPEDTEDPVWVPSFEGQRPPFQVGNILARRHGSYSSVELRGRAIDLAGEIRDHLPLYSPADEPAVRLLSIVLARVERANDALDEVDEHFAGAPLQAFLAKNGEGLDRLRKDLRQWINTAAKLASELGMTPSSRSRMGLDLALAARAADQALDRLGDEGRRIREARQERAT